MDPESVARLAMSGGTMGGSGRPYIMVESSAFFRATEPVLHAIQLISSLPFQDTIVG